MRYWEEQWEFLKANGVLGEADHQADVVHAAANGLMTNSGRPDREEEKRGRRMDFIALCALASLRITSTNSDNNEDIPLAPRPVGGSWPVFLQCSGLLRVGRLCVFGEIN